MIVFVGGLVGAGKSSVARGLADWLEAPCYDVDEVKKEVFLRDPEHDRNLAEGIPFSDQTRRRVYDRVLADLAEMAARTDRVVVDETLHRRELRHVLFDGAERLFGDFCVVWVTARDEVIRARLAATPREGHLLTDPLAMYEGFRRDFEAFERPLILCSNNGDLEETLARLTALIGGLGRLAAGRDGGRD